MGQLFRCYWIPALLAEELPENECPPVRVKLLSERLLAFRDTRGALRADRRVLRPSRRVAVVRPQRGVGPALLLSRLEIRRDRPVHRGAVGAGGKRLLPARSSSSPIRWSSAAGCCGPTWGRPDKQPPLPEWEFATGAGGAELHVEALAGVQLAAGAGRRHRFEPRVVPAPQRSRIRSAVQGRQGQQVQSERRAALFRGGGEPGRPLHRRAPQRRERQLLLAHHPVGDAVVHDDPAARRPSGARPFLDPDATTRTAGPGASTTGRTARLRDARARRHARRPGHPRQARFPARSGRSPTRTTTT